MVAKIKNAQPNFQKQIASVKRIIAREIKHHEELVDELRNVEAQIANWSKKSEENKIVKLRKVIAEL